MKHRLVPLFALCVLLLSGCASLPTTFHDLTAAAPPPASQQAGASLLVGPLTLPAGVDRPQLVLVQADGRLQLAETQRWVASLPRLLSQAVALDISRLTGVSSVYAWPQPGLAQTDLTLLLDVRVFRLAPGKEAELEVAWSLQAKGQRNLLQAGSFHAIEPVAGSQLRDVVQAQQKLVNQLARHLSSQLGATLRQAPPQP